MPNTLNNRIYIITVLVFIVSGCSVSRRVQVAEIDNYIGRKLIIHYKNGDEIEMHLQKREENKLVGINCIAYLEMIQNVFVIRAPEVSEHPASHSPTTSVTPDSPPGKPTPPPTPANPADPVPAPPPSPKAP